MGKQRRRQFFLICLCLIATFYNILPTILYYSQSLRAPLSSADAQQIAKEASARVKDLREDAKKWIASYCSLLKIHPGSIAIDPRAPQTILVSFAKQEEAKKLRSALPRAGALIPFAPARLSLGFQGADDLTVAVQTSLSSLLEPDDFFYIPGNSPEAPSDLGAASEEISGYLVLDQAKVAKRTVLQLQHTLRSLWHPLHPDLREIEIAGFEALQKGKGEQKGLRCAVFSPLALPSADSLPFQADSLFVVAKGIEPVLRFYAQFPDSKEALEFYSDFRKLAELLQSEGFSGRAVSDSSLPWVESGDVVFEKPSFMSSCLMASRENFLVSGEGKARAWLALGDREQRLLTKNKIETAMHEELIAAQDAYHAARVSLDPRAKWDAPAPVRSVLWNNLTLSVRKYFRGDERKILKWGLDLSGGKTVEIALKDSRGDWITQPEDLKQGMEEIRNRVNRLGVSEVAIRRAGHRIILDFPGSQAKSAADLIQASSMHFHIVNERFASDAACDRFLQGIWNEALLLGKKDADSVNEIARRHLEQESAAALRAKGLRLASAENQEADTSIDETFSKIVLWRGADASAWHGKNHPLLIVFRNWVMEGADLENVHAGYDPSKGNFLSFSAAPQRERKGKTVFPKKDLFAWTSLYSKQSKDPEKVSRMAVVLNGSVVSAPVLESALEANAMISGHFSQREVNRLVSDLKAGSLSFSPQILSEKNVSPELGTAERLQGIGATLAALLLCMVSMTVYYRFAGWVASIAVLLNLLILWAILQNIGAALTLAGLAGIILTVGMAVDANVLVFERIKEELALSKHLPSAIASGYKKAYSAIIDSNLTTMIAAMILVNFDTGPVRSFAINLIVGLASSLFTALFITKFYFSGWVQNPKNQILNMADWIRATCFDFLKWTKLSAFLSLAMIVSGGWLVYSHRSSIFGMDFTGGYSLNLKLAEKGDGSSVLERALAQAGIAPGESRVQTLSPPGNYRVLLSMALDLPGKPFASMPQGGVERAEWTVHALQSGGVDLASQGLGVNDVQWTAVSGQMSHAMKYVSAWGFLLCLIAIFVYLAFRFEYRFAMAAILCVAHDFLITVGVMGWLHALGLPIQIDLNTVAALMTIVGYSLNDTIIIFDRIREELRLYPREGFYGLVNRALNATLSRTVMTSGTTLLVLLALLVLGGSSIFGFACVMTVGVFLGTLSSWFIASPLAVFFHSDAKSSFLNFFRAKRVSAR